MPGDRAARIGLWLALLNTALANRREYPDLPTTWVPHLMMNTVGLAMPEIVAALDKLVKHVAQPPLSPRIRGEKGRRASSLAGLMATAKAVTSDPPGWALTMAPVTLAYVVSHPEFNIYKGEMGEQRLAGFGLDAIPHSATAFALTALVYRGLDALQREMPRDAALTPLTDVLARYPVAIALGVLALLTAGYELSEYRIHQTEIEAAGGDETKINMMWDWDDTLHDLASNTAGWLLATLLRPRPTPVLASIS